VLLVVSVVLFAGTELLPGDAARFAAGPEASPERIALLHDQLHMDRGPVRRWADWIAGVLRGDLGTSTATGRPVSAEIGPATGSTAVLAGVAWVVAAAGALVLGIAAGTARGRRRGAAIAGVAATAVAVPEMVWAVLLIGLCSTVLGLVPSVSLVPFGGSAASDPSILVLPVATLAIVGGAWASRPVAAAVAAEDRAPHVRAARLAGLSERRVVVRHLLPGVVGPCAQTLALLVGLVVGGTAVVERAFGYPGVTTVLVRAVEAHDVPVVEAVGLLMAAVLVAALVLADVVALTVDPRSGGRR
jgi:peptide/nickel transport system permease protein